MRPKQNAIVSVGGGLNKKRVLHVPGRVVRREVEGGEVMPVVLDFGSFSYVKPITLKYSSNEPKRLGNRVEASLSHLASRKRQINCRAG